MNRGRFEAYVAARDAFASESLDAFAAELLGDVAEGLLLARDPAEAEVARDELAEALALLVDRGELARRSAA